MIVILTLILALIFLPWPWSLVVIVLAAAFELSLAVFGIRWTRRRRAAVGIQTLVGRTAEVTKALAPSGQVKVDGAIWEARSSVPAHVGDTVLVTGIEGLTLEVEPASPA
jgi:membrane-bound serine protease (ClpP class)